MTDKTTEAFEAWWSDTGEQSLFALNTTTDDDIKILAGIAWEAAIREVLAESKPAPDGRIPKTVFTLDDISKAAEMGRQAGMIDALAEPVQEPVEWHVENVYERGDKYFAWIGDGYVQIFTAPVDAKAIRAEALEEAAKVCRTAQAKGLQSIREAIEAAIRGLKESS